MRVSAKTFKYGRLYSFFIQNKAYLGPEVSSLDKSVYPFLLGKRQSVCYFDVSSGIIGLQCGLRVFSGVIAKRGKVLLVGGEVPFISPLLCLHVPSYLYLAICPWDFSQIRKKKNLDFLVLHEVEAEAISECESRTIPFMVVGGSNSRGATYPCNVNLNNSILSNWYLYAISGSCRRGLYLRNKKFNEI